MTCEGFSARLYYLYISHMPFRHALEDRLRVDLDAVATEGRLVPRDRNEKSSSGPEYLEDVEDHVRTVLSSSKKLLQLSSIIDERLCTSVAKRRVVPDMCQEVQTMHQTLDHQAQKVQATIVTLLGVEATEPSLAQGEERKKEDDIWADYAVSANEGDDNDTPIDESWALMTTRTLKWLAKVVRDFPVDREYNS